MLGKITASGDAFIIKEGLHFAAAAALTAAMTPGGHAPFALGFLSACASGRGRIAALCGTAAGAVLFMNFAQALPHLAAAILIYTAAIAFRDSPVLTAPKAAAITAGGLFLAVNGIYVAQSLSPMEALVPCLAGTALTAASSWWFRSFLDRQGERAMEGGLLLTAALLLSARGITVGEVSLSRAALTGLLLYIAYDRGLTAGAGAGLALGLTVDLCCGSGVFTAAFGLGGLGAGSQSGKRRLQASAAFVGGSGLALLPSTDPMAFSAALEAALGAAVFLLLPQRLFGGKRIRRAVEHTPEVSQAAAWKRRIEGAAQALRDLYDSCGRNVPQTNDENPAIIFDRAAERVCRDCALCQLCWQREYTDTFNALNDATPYLLERGRALPKDFPRHFTDRCIHLADFLTAINAELSAFLLRRQYRRQLEETRRSARGQYAQLSELLAATAAGLGETAPTAAAATACRIGAALRPKEGERDCGDTVVSFRTEEGKWCLLLSDGMGSGEPARRESALTCRLLRQFLESGIAAEAALKTLNAAMALRGAESGSFTTVDLCVYDEGSGEAVLYKYGAAPSYIKKGGSVRRIAGTSLPVGLRGTPAPPDMTKVTLEEGSFLVMVSDGVADPTRDEWLQNLLAGWNGEEPQILAGLILGESIRQMQGQDDCGIQILYRGAEERKEV